MKRLLTLTLIASGLASPLSAFDLDINRSEALERIGVFTVSDLSVGVTGLVSVNFVCGLEGDLYVYNMVLKGDRKFTFFEIELQPNGEFALTFVNNNWEAEPINTVTATELTFGNCNPRTIELVDGIFPVGSVDGFTSYSDWIDHMLTTYEIDDR